MATKKTNLEPVTVVDPMVIDYSQMNVRRKLIIARNLFLAENVKPSGYNGYADFDYFELSDIVPVANRIFEKVGLMLWVSFRDGVCEGRLDNLDKDEDWLLFTIPQVHLAEPSKYRMSELQALGSEITYIRRYMYMIVLDIVQADEIDAVKHDEAPKVKPAVTATPAKATAPKATPAPTEKTTGVKVSVKAASKGNAPATPAERSEIKKELTNANGKADELQINKLKELVATWVEKIPENKEIVTELLLKTNGFKDCTKTEADEYINKINRVIAAAR